ncbi:hypothetical protein ABIA33_004236 [Streptacidiphilus sp. MAP12-16]|uniref:DUF5984 family protein n=1 Tax=Streptacidiphilus sp. MAP12-16 TaxID=3156300 RepID=UPI003518FF04
MSRRLVDFAAVSASDLNWLDEDPEAEATWSWHSHGYLYTSYLRIAPSMRCWRTVVGGDDRITFEWEHQPDPEGVIEFASSRRGQVSVPTAEFLAALAEFDRALLTAMTQRIRELEGAGPLVGIALDLDQVRHEHQDREEWLRRALDHDPAKDWNAVRAGASRIR